MTYIILILGDCKKVMADAKKAADATNAVVEKVKERHSGQGSGRRFLSVHQPQDTECFF